MTATISSRIHVYRQAVCTAACLLILGAGCSQDAQNAPATPTPTTTQQNTEPPEQTITDSFPNTSTNETTSVVANEADGQNDSTNATDEGRSTPENTDQVEQRLVNPRVVILVDCSWSMAQEDAYNESDRAILTQLFEEGDPQNTSRLDLVKAFLMHQGGKSLTQLAEKYDIAIYAGGDQLKVVGTIVGGDGVKQATTAIASLKAGGQGTMLGANLHELLTRERSPFLASLLVLSDGLMTAGPPIDKAIAAAQNADVQIHALAFGMKASPKVEFEDVAYQRKIALGSDVRFNIIVRPFALTDDSFTVRLMHAGETEPVAESTFENTGSEHYRAEFQHRPTQTGAANYSIVTGFGSGESFQASDQEPAKVMVYETAWKPPVESQNALFLERDKYRLGEQVVVACSPNAPQPSRLVVTSRLGETQEIDVPADSGPRINFIATEVGQFSIHAEDDNGNHISTTEEFTVRAPSDGTSDPTRTINHILLKSIAEETNGRFATFSTANWAELVDSLVDDAPEPQTVFIPSVGR